MMARLSTRRYRAGLEPVGVEPKATTRSSISRRFVAGTTKKLGELMSRDLSGLDLLAIFIDGIETAEHTIVAALGVDADGRKHPLGLWEGSTENKTVCQGLLNNLVERGRRREGGAGTAGARQAAAVRSPGRRGQPPRGPRGDAYGEPTRPRPEPAPQLQVHQPDRVNDLGGPRHDRQRQALAGRLDDPALDRGGRAGSGA
jgi:hypothetical protein